MRDADKRRNRQAGFTMMELAAVLGIIAVLATLSMLTYNSLRRRAYEAEAKSFIQEIRVAAWQFRLETGQWPTGLGELGYSQPYESKYFTYTIREEDTNLLITAAGRDNTPAKGIVLTGTLSPEGQLDVSAGTQDPSSITVYITATGSKYHTADCRYLSNSKIPISLKEAKARGYTPCSVCNPPR